MIEREWVSECELKRKKKKSSWNKTEIIMCKNLKWNRGENFNVEPHEKSDVRARLSSYI